MDFNIQAIHWDNEKRRKRAMVIAQQIVHAIGVKKIYSAL